MAKKARTDDDAKFVVDSRDVMMLTQDKLAERLKVTTRTVSRWETGRVDLPHAYRVWINQLLQQHKDRTRKPRLSA